VKLFGRDALGSGGRVDRTYLAERIFTNVRDRRALERILHPAVRRIYLAGMARVRRGVAVVDIPLLYENGLEKKFDLVVVVRTGRARRIRRLAARGFSARDFQRRARAQWPLKKKERLADFVVDNDGTRARTKKQIDDIWNCITNHACVARGKNGHTERS
jgi:dephospho-CoA kinase